MIRFVGFLTNPPQFGFVVTLVDNGRKAVEAFDRGAFDACVFDLNMPVLDGADAAREITEKIASGRGRRDFWGGDHRAHDLVTAAAPNVGQAGARLLLVSRFVLPLASRPTPIVALSAACAEEEQRRCFDSGMVAFLKKPVNLDVIAQISVRC